MGQVCYTDDIKVEYRPNMFQQQSSNLSKNDPGYLHIPQQLPAVTTPSLNENVQTALQNMKSFQSQISVYQRGISSKPRKINALGVIYEGQWKNMSPHGKGKMYFPDSSYYEGFFSNGVPNGQGRLINSYGISYEGQVKNGKATGRGQLVNITKEYHYIGQWIDDIPYGQGRQSFGQESYYEGGFINGIKQGSGVYKKANQFQYDGNFANNQFNGYGQIQYSNGDKYIGDWKNGLFHGEGTYLFASKQKYEGMYYEGLKHGRGKYTDIDGRVFEGVWENGKRKGKGRIYEKNQVIQWNWKNDKVLKKSKV